MSGLTNLLVPLAREKAKADLARVTELTPEECLRGMGGLADLKNLVLLDVIDRNGIKIDADTQLVLDELTLYQGKYVKQYNPQVAAMFGVQ